MLCKYSNMLFCSVEDRFSDGFYDVGRDRFFMFLGDYELNLKLYFREVILLDRFGSIVMILCKLNFVYFF